MSIKYLLIFLNVIPCIVSGVTREEIHDNPKPYQQSCNFYERALGYYYDQEIDKGFESFLEALSGAQQIPEYLFAKEEEQMYLTALEMYLVDGANDPIKTAANLLEKWGPTVEEHPEYHHLQFLLATAYGNLGLYDDFFEKFYCRFAAFKDSFLAKKIQGILHVRLAQHSKTMDERKKHQAHALHFLQLAALQNTEDMGIYKALVFLAKELGQLAEIKATLEKVACSSAKIPRSDFLIHIHEAVKIEEFLLAQQIIDKATKEYEYSRSLIAAQEYLNSVKK